MARTPNPVTPEQSLLLERVAAAARRREDAEARYRRELLGAREAGCTLAAIAAAAGVTTESVRGYLARHQRG